MCLHHPVGAYLCVLSTTIFPYKSRKSKKKSTSVTPTPEKTSDSAFSSKVCHTKVKLEIRNSKNWLSYAASTWRGFIPGPAYHTWGSRVGHAEQVTCRTVAQKLETQNQKEDQISTPHPPDMAIMPNPRSFRTREDFFMICFRKSDFVWWGSNQK